jgi:beta-N-acetylhexosaminidase
MVSHGGFPNIDIRQGLAGGLLEPASLSHSIVTRLLREELGYQHLVVTDDLEMGAIARHCNIDAAVVRAFFAGQDMLLICSRPEMIRQGFDTLLMMAKKGKLSEQRLEDSLHRIAAYKALVQPPPPFDPARFRALSDEIAQLNHKLNYMYGGSI